MKMMVKSLLAATALIGALSVSPASAETITFDDLAGNASMIANGYGGLNWSNFGAFNGSGYATSGYVNGRVSGLNTAFNSGGTPASFSATTPFTLNSGYFTGAWNNGLVISVVGLVDGLQAYSDSFTVDATGPSLHIFNWSNLSSVRFSSAGGVNAGLSGAGNHFVLDNLTIDGAVPEPATWAMMMMGIGAIGFAMRRKSAVKTTVKFA